MTCVCCTIHVLEYVVVYYFALLVLATCWLHNSSFWVWGIESSWTASVCMHPRMRMRSTRISDWITFGDQFLIPVKCTRTHNHNGLGITRSVANNYNTYFSVPLGLKMKEILTFLALLVFYLVKLSFSAGINQTIGKDNVLSPIQCTLL